LRTGHHPIQVEGLAGTGAPPRNSGLAAVLDAAATSIFDFDFELEIEVLGDETVIGDVAVAGGFFEGRFADNGSVIEELGVAFVVGEIEGVGFAEALGLAEESGQEDERDCLFHGEYLQMRSPP
jgi:hypothetical protein